MTCDFQLLTKSGPKKFEVSTLLMDIIEFYKRDRDLKLRLYGKFLYVIKL